MLYTFKKVGHCVTPHCLKGVEIFEKLLKLEVGIPFSVKMKRVNIAGLSSVENGVSTASD